MSILQKLESDFHLDRMNAIDDLGSQYIDRDKARDILDDLWPSLGKGAQTSEKTKERMLVAATHWRLGRTDHIQFVYDNAKSDGDSVRTQAAIILGLIGTDESIRILSNLLLDDTWFPCVHASASSLGRIGDIETILVLEEARSRNMGNLEEAIDMSIRSIKKRH